MCAYTPQALLRRPALHHLQLLSSAALAASAGGTCFWRVLEQVRQRYEFVGYVVMPEHIHLLISEPGKGDPSRVMQAIKQGFARRVLGQLAKRRGGAQQELFSPDSEQVWQRRFYDFNVWSERKRVEKLRYMHRHPGKRGLVMEPEQWAWSSFRSYYYGEVGAVHMNQWGDLKMEIRKVA